MVPTTCVRCPHSPRLATQGFSKSWEKSPTSQSSPGLCRHYLSHRRLGSVSGPRLWLPDHGAGYSWRENIQRSMTRVLNNLGINTTVKKNPQSICFNITSGKISKKKMKIILKCSSWLQGLFCLHFISLFRIL